MLEKNVRRALERFRGLTGGTCDVWRMAGKQHTGARASIMEELTGVKKIGKDAGVNAFRELLASVLGAAGDCDAALTDDVREKCHAYLAEKAPA